MTRPRILDLFCGAGGCSVGYHRAGFDVVGVDLHPQPNYPFEFIQADALSILNACMDGHAGEFYERFDAIHASPPCQAYSQTQRLAGRGHPELIAPTRDLLKATGLPYVIENVVGAPLIDPTMLCGSMFGLDVRRHRLFETNWPLLVPTCDHDSWRNQYPTHARKDKAQHSPVVHVYGTGGGAGKDLELWKRVMETPWMRSKAEVAEAIPPAYTELIGHQLAQWISTSTEAGASADFVPHQEREATCSTSTRRVASSPSQPSAP